MSARTVVSICNPRIGNGAIRRHEAGVTGGVDVADGERVTDADADGGVGDPPGVSSGWAQLASESIVISAMVPTTIRNVPTPP